MVHIAVIGTGRVGQAVAYTLIFERYVDKLTLVDIKPKIAEMTKEELYHACAAHGFDITIEACEHSEFVEDADLIVISAGFPRKPGMTRRDLADENAKIIHNIVTSTFEKNPKAWYFVITNPVDAMATLAYKLTNGERIVVGTGTNLETVRFKTIISRKLNVPLRLVEGFVGGEHGISAVPLWSTVRIDGTPIDVYLENNNKELNKADVESYVKNISMEVIKALGGTRWGPAGSFIEIIRGIILNTGKVLSFAIPRTFSDVPEPVFVTVPGKISRSLNSDIWNELQESEKNQIIEAAKAIYETYLRAYKVVSNL
ncbi:MAG: malate dehydrogenase [Candidatus Asgardarchaeia archaeon]|nr:NAD-binding protein [Candidatus Odinarchaeota archaeon]